MQRVLQWIGSFHLGIEGLFFSSVSPKSAEATGAAVLKVLFFSRKNVHWQVEAGVCFHLGIEVLFFLSLPGHDFLVEPQLFPSRNRGAFLFKFYEHVDVRTNIWTFRSRNRGAFLFKDKVGDVIRKNVLVSISESRGFSFQPLDRDGVHARHHIWVSIS